MCLPHRVQLSSLFALRTFHPFFLILTFLQGIVRQPQRLPWREIPCVCRREWPLTLKINNSKVGCVDLNSARSCHDLSPASSGARVLLQPFQTTFPNRQRSFWSIFIFYVLCLEVYLAMFIVIWDSAKVFISFYNNPWITSLLLPTPSYLLPHSTEKPSFYTFQHPNFSLQFCMALHGESYCLVLDYSPMHLLPPGQALCLSLLKLYHPSWCLTRKKTYWLMCIVCMHSAMNHWKIFNGKTEKECMERTVFPVKGSTRMLTVNGMDLQHRRAPSTNRKFEGQQTLHQALEFPEYKPWLWVEEKGHSKTQTNKQKQKNPLLSRHVGSNNNWLLSTDFHRYVYHIWQISP